MNKDFLASVDSAHERAIEILDAMRPKVRAFFSAGQPSVSLSIMAAPAGRVWSFTVAGDSNAFFTRYEVAILMYDRPEGANVSPQSGVVLEGRIRSFAKIGKADDETIAFLRPYDGGFQEVVRYGDTAGLHERLEAIGAFLEEQGLALLHEAIKSNSVESADLLAWLNARVIGTIVVMGPKGPEVLWNVDDARNEGLTIEDAVLDFADKHDLDIRLEAEE